MARLCIALNLVAALLCASHAKILEHKLYSKSEPKPRLPIKQTTYKAAVYNHQAVYPVDVKTREDAVKAMEKNLNIYEKQASVAGAQGVDILIFPEDGLYLGEHNIDLYLEVIPDPRTITWNPCLEEKRFPGTEVQHRLSCIARNSSLYLVANMGDKKYCTVTSEGGLDSDCTFYGMHKYNTDVVFDPNGTLIARYHKKNLYFEYEFSYPPTTELITFDTPFGRFGLFTCFDSLFHDPAVAVIEKYNVDSIAFPTLWSQTPPFLYAVQWQEAFAIGMKVNFLAANHHQPGGSGIYTPTGAAVYVGNNQKSQLLVATIQSRPKTFPALPIKSSVSRTSSPGVYHSIAFGDRYSFVELSNGTSIRTVCQGTLCCQVNYTLTQRGNDVYALGAFSGVHTAIAKAGMQMCVVMKCSNSGGSMCGQPPLNASSMFSRLVLTGTFTTDYVFPEVLIRSNAGPALSGPDWQFSKQVMSSNHGFSKPLLSASLLGRVYRND